MPKVIYLESDEEITDVIDKISKAGESAVSLVIPRGSTLANSVVNLKLLAKRSESLGKSVSLVTNDKIAKNLASQIGLPVFANINDAKSGMPNEVEEKEMPPEKAEPIEEIDGVKVHQYDKVLAHKGSEPEAGLEEPIKEELAEESEVIEAVKDIDEPDTDEIAMKEIPIESNGEESPISELPEKDHYHLEKKPMVKPDQFKINEPKYGGAPLFDKIRSAKKRKKLIIGGLIAGIVLVIFSLLYIIIPKAKAVISVVSEPYNSIVDIRISKDATSIDNTTSTIPGKLISKEDELDKPFSASGSKNIGEKAKGTIKIYNYWDDKTHAIAAGSKFLSLAGVVFVSISTATVPGGHPNIIPPSTYEINPPGTVDVAVEAESVGEQGNIGPADFTITSLEKTQQSKIYGKSSAAMSGGADKVVKVITDKDLADAKTSTENELKETILTKIKADLGEKEKLLDSASAVAIVSESATAKSGDQVDNFNYKIKLKADVITFSESDFESLLLENAKSKIESNKEIVSVKSVNEFDETKGINYEVKSSDVAKGIIELKGTYDGYTAEKYDVSAIKKEIKGKSIKTATTKITAHSGVSSADITTKPNFFRSIPFIEKKITIEFNYGRK